MGHPPTVGRGRRANQPAPDFSTSSSTCKRTENDDYSGSTTNASRPGPAARWPDPPNPALALSGPSRARLGNVPTVARLAILRRTRSMHKYPRPFHKCLPPLPRRDIKAWLACNRRPDGHLFHHVPAAKIPPFDFRSHFYRKAGNNQLVPKSPLFKKMKKARGEKRKQDKAKKHQGRPKKQPQQSVLKQQEKLKKQLRRGTLTVAKAAHSTRNKK
jgi:hypothetical protein